MPDSLLPSLFQAIDTVVLARRGDGLFRIESPPPDWFNMLWPERPDTPDGVSPGTAFPFLENFLVDAESFWAAGKDGQLKSGIWSEVDESGREYHLEASALSMRNDAPVLLIAFPRMDYQEKFHIIQRGREIHLEYDRIVREIQKKEVLLHCIIHDLKGPLAVMNGVFGLAEDAEIPAAELQNLMRMGQEYVSRQERMIQDVLEAFSGDIDQLDTFSQNPEEAPDILDCARSVVAGFESAFARLDINVALVNEPATESDWRVVGDHDHLERIFSNLLENALRYSPAGSIITVGCLPEGDQVAAFVEDQGPGVPDNLRNSLFDKFVHGQQRPSSSGIGLFFCRITIERWGGQIGVNERDGGGSRFWFRLPRP